MEETTYALGFPGKTETRQALGAKDASEDTLSWTIGKFVFPAALRRSSFERYLFSYNSENLWENEIFVTDNDGSGGRLFNCIGSRLWVHPPCAQGFTCTVDR